MKFLTASWIIGSTAGLLSIPTCTYFRLPPGKAAEFLTSTKEPVQLAVVGSSDASKVTRMVGPITPHFGHAGRSVLVVRDEHENNPG